MSVAPLSSWLLAASLIGLSLLIGGSSQSGLWSDALLQLASLIVLVAGLATLTFPRRVTVPLVIIALTVAVPLLQLVPLPPPVWTSLPGRAEIASTYQLAGIALPWLPISLDPASTWRAIFSLLPAIAVFIATIQLDWRSRRTLTLIVICAAIISVMLGLAQLAEGFNSPLRLYTITNESNSVGFFANRNHYAALLYTAIPLVAAWIIALLHDHRPERLLGLVAGITTIAVLYLGIAMSRSRAGVLLGGGVTMGSLVIAIREGGRYARAGLAILAVAAFVGLLASIYFAFFDVAARFSEGTLDDFRLPIARIAAIAAATFQPVGSGIGTFVPVYQMFEPVNAILSTYVNHAHDDWLEVYLEGGVLAAAVVVVFLVWFIKSVVKTWSRRTVSPITVETVDRALACSATVSLLALMVHSGFDYPLRTSALMTVFAFGCALLVDPVPRRETSASTILQRLTDRLRRRRGVGWVG